MRARIVWISVAAVAALAGWLFFVLSLEQTADHPLGPQAEIGRRWLQAPGAEAAYVGDGECRTCHPAQFESHSGSPHARTVRRISDGELLPEFQKSQTVQDELSGRLFSVRQSGGKNLVVSELGGEKQEGVVRWAFGSGTHAWTYLGEAEKGYTEFKISYYPPVKEWNLTPGSGPLQTNSGPLGPDYSPTEAAACFGCHSTALIGSKEGLDLERSRLNVGCESCHGAGRAHVESARGAQSAASLVRPLKMDTIGVMQKCGACHRLPGDVKDDPLIESQLARFPGVALVRSRCFLESGGKLSCITCHDPHEPLSRSQESYDKTCRSCHSAPHQTQCLEGKKSDCSSCHMPEQSVARKLHLRFHNHWIRSRIPDEERLQTQFSAALRAESPE